MRDATRYLAAAGYLDPSFRESALRELVRNRYRGVAPSHGGVDVVPVLRHCLRARSFLLTREIALTAILLGGLFLMTGATLNWIVTALLFALLATGPFRALKPLYRLFSLLLLMSICGFISTMIVFAGLAVTGLATPGALTGAPLNPIEYLLLPLVTLGVAVAYRFAVCRTLSRELRPGAHPPPGQEQDPVTEERLQWIGDAQRGSLTLYSGTDPFLGAGRIARAWTIAVELDRKAPAPESDRRTHARETTAVDRRQVRIDPLELHGFVRRRLEQMSRQAQQPDGIINLKIRDQVVVAGRFNQIYGPGGDGRRIHPLVDFHRLRPLTGLSQPMIEALIHNPQAGARYYQRLDINSEGNAILDETGRPIIPAEDRGTSVTAFIHLAVEGRMLYTEFIVTVLPPVAKAYRLPDELPRDSSVLLAYYALKGRYLELFKDVVAAPIRLLRMTAQAVRDRLRVDDPTRYTAYDYGARFSLRELGAAPWTDDFIQYLDAYKYTKLVEERLTAAVLDLLDEKGVDTAAYRRQVAAVSISSTTHYNYNGEFSNSQFGGANSQFGRQNAAQSGQEGA